MMIQTGLRLSLGILLIFSVIARIGGGEAAVFSPAAQSWLDAIRDSGYLLPLLLATEFLIGVLLLINRWTPLALVLFAPININIFFLHLVLDSQPIRIIQIGFMVTSHLLLVWYHRDVFRSILFAPHQPVLLIAWQKRTNFTTVALRSGLGGLFLITGLSKLLFEIDTSSTFIAAMQATGFVYPQLGAVETLIGVMLISGRGVALALLMLVPVLANILLYHLFLDFWTPLTLVSAAASGVTIYLVRQNFDYFAPLLEPNVRANYSHTSSSV